MTPSQAPVSDASALTDAFKVLEEIAAGHESWPYGDDGGRECPMLGVAEARALLQLKNTRALLREAREALADGAYLIVKQGEQLREPFCAQQMAKADQLRKLIGACP